MKAKKTWRILGVAFIIGAVSLLLAIAGLAIGLNGADEPEMNIIATNLSFSDSIYIKYAVTCENVDNVDNVKLLVWRDANGGYTLENEGYVTISTVGRATVAGEECLIFNYTELAAKEMTDYVYARAVYEKNGNTYYSDVRKYSILTYVYNKLGYTGTPTQNESLAELLRGMLEYGASAQSYFNYKTDALATDKYVKITLENGYFEDGCRTALVRPGTNLNITAPTTTNEGGFAYWKDADGKIITDLSSFEFTAGDSNISLTAIYCPYEGGKIDGAGATLSVGSFAMTEHTIDSENVIDLTAEELESIISQGLEAGKTYRVTDGRTVTVRGRSINGKGASLIVPMGLIIEDASSKSIYDLTVSGSITINSSSNVTFARVDIQSTSTALTISDSCPGFILNDCRLTSTGVALESNSAETTLKSSYLAGSDTVIGKANGFAIHNCMVITERNGISISKEDCSATNNTVISDGAANGIVVESGALNSLITYNQISGGKTSVKITEATNTVVLFNSVFDTVAENNTNLYVVENSIGGTLRLTNNNYLLCDSNSYTDNGKSHTPILSGNENCNGDSLMDVNARNEVGAKEDLLPHTNKDLFLDMERKSTVKDITGEGGLDLNTYIENKAKSNSVVIVPPGAYSTAAGDPMAITAEMSNTDIYAFGVYNEHHFNKDFEYRIGAGANNILSIANAENVTIHGISLAYDYQSSGQVYVLDKLENNHILVVPAAGYDLEAGFGRSNTDIFSNSYTSKYGAGNPYSALGGTGYEFVSRNEDGTLILRMTTAAAYDAMNVGDIMTCRMAGDNQHTVSISNTKNVKFKDMILYGYSAALMTVVSGESTGTQLERVHNTARAPFVIDKETYDMYAAWEKEYGVDLEIYIDAEGRYRGSLPRVGSVDATHVTGAAEGLDITSCLFENMCDDGSNQRGGSSRLAGIKNNGDGTTTLYIKGMVTSTYHGIYKQSDKKIRDMNPISFSAGDSIYVYTSQGKLLCDTVTLAASKLEDDLTTIYDYDTIRYIIYFRSVKVATDAVNFDVLEGYDLSDNNYSMKNKVLVDNISHVSQGFVIDNLMVRNSTARGVLVKSINATVKNSTFRNVTSTGNLLSVETSWGESTVARNILISGCLFDNTGFSTEDPIRAPIAISGLSTYGNATVDTLRASDILITGCVFNEYGHNFGIYVNGAQNVRIIDNVFDPEDAADPGQFVKILTAINVEISGNKYRDKNGNLSTISNLDADDYTHIHGSDVGDTYKSDCDIYVGNNHLSSMRIHYSDASDRITAEILANKLADICGYAVSYSNFYNENVIRLVVSDKDNEQISSNTYTVTSDGKNLTITAATHSALVYAVNDFADYIEDRNQTEQTIVFDAGYSLSLSFDINNLVATDTSLIKYSGLWNGSGNAMSSVTNSDYFEFDITGNAFTLLFSEKSDFILYIDGTKHGEYTANSEKTFAFNDGTHTVKVLCKDINSKIILSGIKYSGSQIKRTADKTHYVQFIGDSMLAKNNSFAHAAANVLGWDYSVIVGDEIPSSTSIGRIPDTVLVFLGTDAISAGASQTDITLFASKYESLVRDIITRYGSSTKIHLMQAISTSDANAMFDTNHARYRAIELAMSYCSDLPNVSIISAQTLISWNIEFDVSKDTTNPTDNGYDTLVMNLTKHLANNAGYTDYYNHSFDINQMKNFNGKMQTGLVENGIKFTRYNFIDKNGNAINGHVFISGDDYANKIVTDSGRYLIFKFRSTADYGISFNLRTNDYGTNLAESGKNYVSTISRSEASIKAGVWEVAVIDLAEFAHYTTGVHIGVQVRITTTMSEIDIADVTIVNTLADANMYIISNLGDSEYVFYERWDERGVKVSVSGRDIVEEEDNIFDLSFVNHNFNLISMKMYNGSSINSPTEMLKTDSDGTVYNHFEFTKTGHIFFKGSNTLTPIQGDTGNYLVIKYRASNDSYLRLEMQTSDLPYNSTYPYQTMTYALKQAENIPEGWEVAVIDLAKFSSYQRDSDYDVLIRITTVCSYVDIAYIALVDDMNEAEIYVKAMGDSSYVSYADWSKNGTTVTLK